MAIKNSDVSILVGGGKLAASYIEQIKSRTRLTPRRITTIKSFIGYSVEDDPQRAMYVDSVIRRLNNGKISA